MRTADQNQFDSSREVYSELDRAEPRRAAGTLTPEERIRVLYQEHPLRSLPPDQAAAFVSKIYRKNERMYRAMFWYWRVRVGMEEEAAAEKARAELHAAEAMVLGGFNDPNYYTIGTKSEAQASYEPAGLFSLRDLTAHPQGRVLAEVISSCALRNVYRGRLAIAHSVAVLDRQGGRTALSTIFLSIALKALDADCSHVLFFTSDHRLHGIYQRFGMEFPPQLAFPDTHHLVGSYDPRAPGNLQRMREGARVLGQPLGRWAA
jgi:hypothetical protein